MDHSLSVIGMWAQLPLREHVVITEWPDFIMQKTLCEEVELKFSKFRGGKKEYKFSVKHFSIWCHKCDTMFFVDKIKTNFIHLS
jgi:hypothetical protein